MSDEKDLIRKRGSFKGRLTAFSNYLQSLSAPLDEAIARELQLRMSKVESLYEQYDEVQLQIECMVDDMRVQLNERTEFESQYYKVLASAQGLLSDFNKSLDESVKSGSRVSNHKLVKLPTIQLPKFGGSYDNWLEFHDTFASLIHSNEEIDEINKFHYLRASLEGSAAVVIQSIEFSASNYAVAWKLLCERFDNKRLLIQNHVSALFNIETINKESSNTIKRLIDQLNKNLRALESLGEPVKQWDTLLIYIVTHKLDQKTYREWEEFKGHLDKDSSTTFQIFIDFLRTRADLIETLELSRNNNNNNNSGSNKSNHKIKSMVSQSSKESCTESSPKVCPKCHSTHTLYNCPQFLAMSNEARLKSMPTYKVCFNCFRTGHYANSCKRAGCKLCKRRHNTLIHVTDPKSIISSVGTENNSASALQSSSTSPPTPPLLPSTSLQTDKSNVALSANLTCSQMQHKEYRDVLLSTALVKLRDYNNKEHVFRAVLDSGSTSCFITENACSKLNLPTKKIDTSIMGINNATSRVGITCRVTMKSLNDRFCSDIHCYVLPSITDQVPNREINILKLNIPSDICLADPTFYKPSDIDILLGADTFWDIIRPNQIRLGNQKPILCETELGWIISGPLPINVTPFASDARCNFIKVDIDSEVDDIKTDLTRFWQLEETNPKLSHYSPDEKLCEKHFVENTTRLGDGRFCVRIPIKRDPQILGDSFQRARQCLISLERRLNSKPDMNKMYHDFMREYQLLGHMTECQLSVDRPVYFMPHHGVLRESSTTTKLRVVFNASSPTTSGASYNNIQMVGPTVQDDLLSILLRFRQHKYILSADVEKMYRQVVVHPSDRHLQQILWREDPCDPIKLYQLNTVTYGTASAPFLATRCLNQVGVECTDDNIADIIKHDFYVDDLLTGGNDLNEVKIIRNKVTEALASVGMPLRKWISNEPSLVSDAAETALNLNIGSDKVSKLLGLGWHAKSDTLCFPIDFSVPASDNTKRDLLSAIARIFDPLGLLAPCIIVMKMLLQELWLHKLTWDEPLPPRICNTWNEIIKSLPSLGELNIPRFVICDSYKTLELHIFTDASERAYGACAYVRSINDDGEIMVRLLMAKSRVAPIKPTTIPRLELCGALIGVRIYEKVDYSLRVKVDNVFFWTDSTIVLGWLRMLPSKLQPFVRNRVAEILDKAENCTWKHVPTDHNPADLISRGIDIRNLHNLELWWSGPDYLKESISKWPSPPKYAEKLPETRPEITLNVVNYIDDNLIDFNRFSSYLRLVRSMAFVLRFIKSCQRIKLSSKKLTAYELQNALEIIIKVSQNKSFPEYDMLLNNKELPKKSPLHKFNVYLDDKKIMRVGGRLDNSNFNHEKKHPILIQSTHIFTKLLFQHEHKRLMHAGPQLLLASIRENYWPIGGRNLAKTCFRNCVLCTRIKSKTITPLMGNLPQQRLLPNGHPFESVGVDYAGPVLCANRQGRGCRLTKAYIAVFVCFTTKAIHLELVGNLTSNNYIMALRRFIARRGKPLNIHSDNGTSFVGAYNEISKFLKANCSTLSETFANDDINFHFIPAYSPHFGGLWEAGVKSVKYHLQRVLGNCNQTFEELNTTLTLIEAILNSRPLTPISSDPADYTPLTPGHFLVGRPLTCLPQRDFQQSSTNYLSRFQRIEQLRQHFWARWSKEYIAELQLRTKWRSCKDALKLDTMVVVKEDHLPPLKWRLGRVVAVHPGPDGVVRVADIRTSSGVIRRAFSKICPLPVASESV